MARVLIIDDEASDRLLVSEVARGMGCEVVEAEDGAEGLRKFRDFLFDLVITDIVMPNADGLEVVESLRQLSADVQIIAHTASDPDDEKGWLELARERGANVTLNAPFTRRDIQRAIRETLGS